MSDHQEFDRNYLPRDLFEDGWSIYRYSDRWEFDDEQRLKGRDVHIGLWKKDAELGVIRGEASGDDPEAVARAAVENAHQEPNSTRLKGT